MATIEERIAKLERDVAELRSELRRRVDEAETAYDRAVEGMKAHVGVALRDAVKAELPAVVRAELGALGLAEQADKLDELVRIGRGADAERMRRAEREEHEIAALKRRERELELEKKRLEIEVARVEATAKARGSIADADVKKLDAGTRNLKVRGTIIGTMAAAIVALGTAAIYSQCSAPHPTAPPAPAAYMSPEHDAGH